MRLVSMKKLVEIMMVKRVFGQGSNVLMVRLMMMM
jgi:hypothetical protein